MNSGVELLLERMKTHPEEFTEQGKWVSIMQDMHKYAEKEESDTLNKALKALMMQKITEKVLEELVDPKSVMNPYLASPTAMPLGGQTQGHSTAVNQATNALNAIGSGYTLTANGAGQVAWSNTASTQLNANSLQIGNQTLDQETLEHMKAHLDWLKRDEKLKAKRWWNKSIPELLGGKK